MLQSFMTTIKQNKTWLALLISVFFLGGCWQDNGVDRQPVDELSKSVKQAVGDSFVFRQRDIDEEGGLHYSFEILVFDAEAMTVFFEACNDALPVEEKKVSFSVCFYFPG